MGSVVWRVASGSAVVIVAMAGRSPAQADEPSDAVPVAFGADQVRLDPLGAVEAIGHVHVDEPPFHLTSDALVLRRVPLGAQLDGEGRVAFCPCLGTPFAVHFRGATVAPPHDLILRDPVLEVFGVPIAYAPVFWLRSPGRFGLLAPDVAWRGADGLFLGVGVHLPWRAGDVAHGLDLRAARYVRGGVNIGATLRTPESETRITWDQWQGDEGILLAAHGSTAIVNAGPGDSVAWNVDALRGGRALKATTDLGAAALPFDRAVGQVEWRPAGWVFASGLRTVDNRGGNRAAVGFGGPVVVARAAEGIGRLGAYDATVEGGAVEGPRPGPTSFVRGEGGGMLDFHTGPVEEEVVVRAFGDAADDGARAAIDVAAQARIVISLPLARTYGGAEHDGQRSWVHRTEPRISGAVLGTSASAVPVTPLGRGFSAPAGRAWVLAGGWDNAVGRWGSQTAAEIDASAGAVGDRSTALPALRVRAAAQGIWFALDADFARLASLSGDNQGGALVASVRMGPASGLHLSAHIAERDGVDPIVARALLHAPLEPAGGFLNSTGWTGGARLAVPLGLRVTTRAGADVDFDADRAVEALAMLELHDPCNCSVVRATVSRRIGRDGVDAWLAVDLSMP